MASNTTNTYLIVDLEATCSDAGEFPRTQMEIIEIGAVAVQGKDLTALDEFQAFVRPVRNPTLTAFCTRLTGITQAQVKAAPTFPEVNARFQQWVAGFANPVFCSWGNYDRNQFLQDCAHHQVPYPFPTEYHINIKTRFAKRQGIGKAVGMKKALELTGLPLEGAHHRGIDDARNMVKLMPYLFGQTRLRSRRP